MTTTKNEGFLPEGYPETPPPAHGHPAYLLFAHLLNAITVQPGDVWVPLDQREAAARRALTVAVWNVREALHRASDAVVDLVEPNGIHSPREDAAFSAGFSAAQNQALQAIEALETRLVGGVKSTVEMAIPDVPDQAS